MSSYWTYIACVQAVHRDDVKQRGWSVGHWQVRRQMTNLAETPRSRWIWRGDNSASAADHPGLLNHKSVASCFSACWRLTCVSSAKKETTKLNDNDDDDDDEHYTPGEPTWQHVYNTMQTNNNNVQRLIINDHRL